MNNLNQRNGKFAKMLCGTAMMALLLTSSAADAQRRTPEPYKPAVGFNWTPGPSNRPIGEAKGIFPGRVVMTRNPEAAKWGGRWDVNEDQWFLDKNTDTNACEEMIEVALEKLTGAADAREAWRKVFEHYNLNTRKMADRGYKPGETIAIKINLNNSSSNKQDNQSDATPQMVLALVRQLVNEGGVNQKDILIYDIRRQIYSQLLTTVWKEFKDVRFVQDGPARKDQAVNPGYGDHTGLEAAEWMKDGVEYSSGSYNDAKTIAKQVADATYMINFAMLKLHSYPYNYMEDGDNGQTAVTMTGKNHFGSIRGTGELHAAINPTQKAKEGYSPIVDLAAAPNLGAKTILYLLDGLYCGRKWRTYPIHFPNYPFNNRVEPYENPEWPACLLASFDEVAIQSVGLDLMYAQSKNNTEPSYHNVPRIMLRENADDFLKEMATPQNAPSGVKYMQGGKPVQSLGVFEHWNNDHEMQYSRNLDPVNGKGIEFIYVPLGSAAQLNKGIDKFDFFYAGESPRHRMYKVEDGEVIWSYIDNNGRGEISDAVLMDDDHVLVAHQHGIMEVDEKGNKVWSMDAPKGYEIHSIQPAGKNHVVYVQCGEPMTAVVMEIPSKKIVKEFKLPYRDGGSHGQNRMIKLTKKGTLLVANMQLNTVFEFNDKGKKLNEWKFNRVWGVDELPNGNILVTGNNGEVREINRKGKEVWSYDWVASDKYPHVSTQRSYRLDNGNTVIGNWFNSWNRNEKLDRNNPPAQFIEVTPSGEIVWELRSWNAPADLGPSTVFQLLSKPVKRSETHFGSYK